MWTKRLTNFFTEKYTDPTSARYIHAESAEGRVECFVRGFISSPRNIQFLVSGQFQVQE